MSASGGNTKPRKRYTLACHCRNKKHKYLVMSAELYQSSAKAKQWELCPIDLHTNKPRIFCFWSIHDHRRLAAAFPRHSLADCDTSVKPKNELKICHPHTSSSDVSFITPNDEQIVRRIFPVVLLFLHTRDDTLLKKTDKRTNLCSSKSRWKLCPL